MKWVVPFVLLLACVLLGWTALGHYTRGQEAEREAAALAVERDAALMRAMTAQIAADSVEAVVDSLEAVRVAESRQQQARARVLILRADSLTAAIGELMPPELVSTEIAEAVMDAVSDLRHTYDQRIVDLVNLLTLTENTLERSREQVARVQEVNASLRTAFAALEQERDVWRSAANPGLLKRLKQDAGLLGTAAAFGGVVVLALTGGPP